MEDKIDYIISGIFFLFFIIGCFKGFLKAVIGPLSLIACWTYALYHYKLNQNFMIAVGISMLGPIILSIGISLILKIFKKIFNKEAEISPLSRLAGGVVSMAWSGFYFILMILLVAMIPINTPKFKTFKEDLKKTKSYYFAKVYVANHIPSFDSLDKISSAIEDPQIMEEISQSKRFKKLLTNSKVQNLYEDPEIKDLIKDKNYSQLISNPKIQELMKDQDLVMEFAEIVNDHSRNSGLKFVEDESTESEVEENNP